MSSAHPARTRARVVAFFFAASLSLQSAAQDPVTAKLLDRESGKDLYGSFARPLIDSLLESTGDNELLTLLSDLNLEPKVFDVEGTDSDWVPGLNYDYKKSIKNRTIRENSTNPLAISWSLEAKGSIAADASKNPNNFLESGTTFHLFQGIGGVRPTLSQTGREALAAEIFAQRNNEDFQNARGAAYERLAKTVSQHFAPQLLWDLQGHATLESDQKFKKKSWTYGAKLAVVARHWAADSKLGRLNIIDYPFAATRWLFDGEPFLPSGRSFPSAVLGLDQVDPAKDADRLKLDPDDSVFARLRLELAFKTRIMHVLNTDVYLHAAYRHFDELSASQKIKSAGLDRSEYFVLKVDLPANTFLSYTRGRLPFDRQSDKVYELGWNWHR